MSMPFYRSCPYCTWAVFDVVDFLRDFELDHQNPMALGGPDAAWNMVWVCKWCNRQKGAKTDLQYRVWRLLNPDEATYGPHVRSRNPFG